MKQKILASFLLIIVLFSFITPNYKIFAAINEEYGQEGGEIRDDNLGSNSTVLNWIAEIAYTFGEGVEKLGSKLVKLFTGQANFPWIDKIIFNTIPILDVNFINPASGSFFEKSNGDLTIMGKIVRNTYFTVLALSIGFVSILVSIMAIRLAISSMGALKFKYIQAIQKLALTLVLLFGMHFLIAFMFFINEKLVEAASSFLTSVLYENAKQVIEQLEEAEDENNKKMVQNFFRANNDICFIDSIPLVGDIWNAWTGFLQGLGRALNHVWNWITGADGEEKEVSKEELGKLFPSLDDYNEYFLNEDKEGNYRSEHNPKWQDWELEMRQDVLAYLLKNKFYRKTYLQWTSGTDVNSLGEGGVGGVCRNVLMCINDVVGIADTGYKSAKTVFSSVAIIVHGVDGSEPVKTTEQDAYDNLSDEERKRFDDSEEGRNVDKSKNKMDDTTYYNNIITSKEEYDKYIEDANNRLAYADTLNDDNQKKAVKTAANLDILYANAYFKYCYNIRGDKDDYPKTQPNELITGLGRYFKGQAWYVNIDQGGWAPDYINPVAAIVYTMLIVQSLFMFISYIKRFFYVIILSLIGPVVVVYDFGMSLF